MEGERFGIYERDGSEIEIVQNQNDENFEKFKERILSEIGVNLNDFDVMFVRKNQDHAAKQSDEPATATLDISIKTENRHRSDSAYESDIGNNLIDSGSEFDTATNDATAAIKHDHNYCKVEQSELTCF